MTDEIRVLGVDLASSKWSNNGAAVISFKRNTTPSWMDVQASAIQWPNIELNAESMAKTIEAFVREHAIHAVSLDGPQGWRQPNASERAGVGRWCEFQAHAQGKTGLYGRTYPRTQEPWIRFCIDVFQCLRHSRLGHLVNDTTARDLRTLENPAYWLLECFPTSTWRTGNLLPLPGKRATTDDQVRAFAQTLWARFGLPGMPPDVLSHDDLQAIVAALPAAALLGGPCFPSAKGKAGWWVAGTNQPQPYWVEGIIWDATLSDEDLDAELEWPGILQARVPVPAPGHADNPIMIDDRDEHGERLLVRGAKLFQYLAKRANFGDPVGVGYKQFVCLVHGVEYGELLGRGFVQADVPHVLGLAAQVTASAGGRQKVAREETTIDAAMDTFIWPQTPPHRRAAIAFQNTPYTAAEWETVFPTGERRILQEEESEEILTEYDRDERI